MSRDRPAGGPSGVVSAGVSVYRGQHLPPSRRPYCQHQVAESEPINFLETNDQLANQRTRKEYGIVLSAAAVLGITSQFSAENNGNNSK